jgi:RNA polymerase sigma-70 factor, ECF subfamily
MLETHWSVVLQSTSTAHGETESKPMNSMESFETYRSYLFSIAYRMLGGAMDAEDMVQETYLRYQAASSEEIRSLKAFLTTIVTRLCIDQLQLAYRQRETYLGPWLPEPILTGVGQGADVEEDMAMKESLSLAYLVLLEELQPAERAVFLLREVFDYDYADIARFVGKKEPACRQLFSRAKKHLAASRSEKAATPAEQQHLMTGFVEAVRQGDTEGLMHMLSADVTLVADGGGKVAGAATHPVVGRADVAQFSVAATRRFLPPSYVAELAEVNYQPAIIGWSGGRAVVVMTVEVDKGLVKTVRFMANPDKLSHLRRETGSGGEER